VFDSFSLVVASCHPASTSLRVWLAESARRRSLTTVRPPTLGHTVRGLCFLFFGSALDFSQLPESGSLANCQLVRRVIWNPLSQLDTSKCKSDAAPAISFHALISCSRLLLACSNPFGSKTFEGILYLGYMRQTGVDLPAYVTRPLLFVGLLPKASTVPTGIKSPMICQQQNSKSNFGPSHHRLAKMAYRGDRSLDVFFVQTRQG
jgi:hypothetical protein